MRRYLLVWALVPACGGLVVADDPPPTVEPDPMPEPPPGAPDMEPGPPPLPGEAEEPRPPLTPLGAWVALASPQWGMHFLEPAELRLQAAALDPSSPVWGMPRQVEFFLGERRVGTAARDPGRPGLYVVRTGGVPAGTYLLTAVALNENGTRSTSLPVRITVDPRREGGRPVRVLREDIVLSGQDSLTLEGTAEAPLLVVGGGRRIRSAPGWRGRLVLRHCDVQGLGSPTLPAIEVSVAGAGAVVIDHVRFDACGLVQVGLSEAASVSVQRSEFRANALMPVVDQPSTSAPAFRAVGTSSGSKLFQGNRIGLSWAAFERGTGWLIGGNRDEDMNMAWGIRAGLHVLGGSDVTVRGNYSHDTCGPGLSQCLNFEFADVRNLLVEHNVVRASAWPVRGVSGEVRYNLILDSGHSWLQAPASGTRVHHNVFAQVSGPVRYAPEQGVFLYGATGVELYNNTFDGGGRALQWAGQVISIAAGAQLGSLRSNAFVRFAPEGTPPLVGGSYGERLPSPGPERMGYADYNLFYNPEHPRPVAYAVRVSGRTLGQPGFGAHDLGRDGPGVDPRLPPPPLPYPIPQGALWTGELRLSQVLAAYRAHYLPGAGSPLIDRGDPADGPGNDIGAVGAGAPHPADRFGLPFR
ncbi:MAG: right-handed parallel beta-helix repeat-containing protein [Myxococcales bacterium]|nr:right-handed parallel beta-helix repeat-containing protein [Myxococcota bacterium]MDW8284220.1 right-handed parallel beta-helix repeat-containing protein [Myxococcales bacterium]